LRTLFSNAVVLVLAMFGLACPAEGQIVYYAGMDTDTSEIIHEVYPRCLELREEYRAENLEIRRFDLMHHKDRLLLLPSGTLDVFEWRGGEWVNLYSRRHNGYNYGSKNFVVEDRLFSYGGYGFWHSHGQIIEFDFELGNWEILPFSRDLPACLATIEAQQLKLLCKNKIITIDLSEESLVHQPIHYAEFEYMEEEVTNIKTIDSGRYFCSPIRPQFIYDKSEDKFLYSERGDIFFYSRHSFSSDNLAMITDTEIRVYDSSLKLRGIDNIEDNLDKFTYIRQATRPAFLYILCILLIVMGLLGIIYARMKKHKTGLKENIYSWEFLEQKKGQLITQEELDRILGLEGVSQNETLRYRRAKIINEINEHYKVIRGELMIKREKDPADKRRFLYRIRADRKSNGLI